MIYSEALDIFSSFKNSGWDDDSKLSLSLDFLSSKGLIPEFQEFLEEVYEEMEFSESLDIGV